MSAQAPPERYFPAMAVQYPCQVQLVPAVIARPALFDDGRWAELATEYQVDAREHERELSGREVTNQFREKLPVERNDLRDIGHRVA